MRSIFICLGLGLSLSFAAPAMAQGEESESAAADAERSDTATGKSFEYLVKEGVDAYKGERFEEAITAFEQAFAIKPEANLQYNIGRSHERLGHLDEAISAFEAFLALPGTRSGSRTKALESIATLKRERSAREAAANPPPPAAGAPPASGAPAAQQTVSTQPQREGRSRALEIGLLGAGGVLAVTGAVFGLLASGEQSNFDDATSLQDRNDAADAGKRWALLADVGIFGGVALAGAGLVTWLVRGESDDAAVAVGPSPDGTGAMAGFTGSF